MDPKTNRKVVIFNKYKLDSDTACPECKRVLKPRDIQALKDRTVISCPKCGAKLER